MKAISISYNYIDDGHGFPILKRRVERYKLVGGSEEVESRQDFDWHLEGVPESAFTLSAFGFPEPPGLARRQTPWFLWAALAGVACIGASLLLRRWVQRHGVGPKVAG